MKGVEGVDDCESGGRIEKGKWPEGKRTGAECGSSEDVDEKRRTSETMS